MQVAPRATQRRRRRFFRLAAGLLVAGASGLAFVLWSRASPESLLDASSEDGPIEYATVLAFLAAALGFAVAARHARARPAPLRALLFLYLGSLVMLFFSGEELSWGQRILGFDTPEPLRRMNEQREFNVHNLAPLHGRKYSMLVATVALVGLALPALRLLRSTRRLAARIGLPLPASGGVGLFLASLFFLRHAANWLGIDRRIPQEIGELFFALAMAVFGVATARAAGRRSVLAPDRGAPSLAPPPPLPPPRQAVPSPIATHEPRVSAATRRD